MKTFIKKNVKKITRPLYWRMIHRLTQDLQIKEQQRLIHHLITQVDNLSKKQQTLTAYVEATNVLLSGIYALPHDEESVQWQTTVAYDIFSILSRQPQSAISIIHYFDQLNKISLANTSVCFIGAQDNLYTQQAKKHGATSVIRIEMNPLLAHHTIDTHLSDEHIVSVYPTKLGNIALPLIDFLLVPDIVTASFLIKYILFNIGAKVRQAAVVTVPVKTHTIFSTNKHPPFFVNEYHQVTSFNDQYVRGQLHKSGFVEVECIYTQGEKVTDPFFDTKVTHLSYKDDYSVVKNNKITTQTQFTTDHVSFKTYVARKLPSLPLIKPTS